jgi:hypothetical protein
MRRIITTLAIAFTLTGCSSKRTPPAQIMNSGADISLAALPNNPLAWRVVTSGSNRTTHIMYTLYGNDNAITHARTRAAGKYPAGAQLALVTWTAKEDPHWFGGYIPASPQSVEYVSFDASTPQYTRFTGQPLAPDTTPANPQRIADITSMQAALMP